MKPIIQPDEQKRNRRLFGLTDHEKQQLQEYLESMRAVADLEELLGNRSTSVK